MGAINEIFREFAPEYLRRFGDAMPEEHKKVVSAIVLCRTKENGTVVYRCEECGLLHPIERSCGNRHCPQCQSHKANIKYLAPYVFRVAIMPYFSPMAHLWRFILILHKRLQTGKLSL